jgi:hypothetical protein
MEGKAFLCRRPVVFFLAWLSFACLLGQFYGLWSMRLFACLVLPPATALLVYIAFISKGTGRRSGPAAWIIEGTLGGIVAAVAYDLYRLPFVLNGAPLFKVFPQFGMLIVGADKPLWVQQAVGWTYHFSNGAALGIMFLAMAVHPTRITLFWGAVVWAMFVEAMLLLTPYTKFFGLPFNGRFIFLTATAHLVFGVALGIWSVLRLGEPRSAA